MIYTSYFGKTVSNDIAKISIALWSPRSFTGSVFSELAPTKEILSNYKYCFDYGNVEYIRDFKAMLGRLDAKAVYEKIEKTAQRRDAALLCYEKSGFCHRHLVGAWFIENGIFCEEY